MYDYYLATGDEEAKKLFDKTVHALTTNLMRYDTGFWSLYDLNQTRLWPLASPFYHRLHVMQLKVMHRLTWQSVFLEYANLWESYRKSYLKKSVALGCKALFKIFYY